MSLESDRYSYIFVRLLIDTGATGKDLEYHIKQTTIHELGHQLRLDNAVVIMGTATPSLDSYYRALKGQWTLLQLTQRVEGKPLPEVRLLDERFTSHRRSEIFTDPLIDAMASKSSCF